MTTILPGKLGPWVDVNAALRARHDVLNDSIKKRIEKRRKTPGVPLDEQTDWLAVEGMFAEAKAALADHNAATFRERVLSIFEATSKAPAELPPYEDSDALAGVRIRVRKLSKQDVALLGGEVDEIAESSKGDEGAARKRLMREVEGLAAQGRFVQRAIGALEIDGQTYEGAELSQEAIDVLTYREILPTIYVLAMEGQSLSPFARTLFGSSPPAISPSSTATHARSESERSADASTPQSAPCSAPTIEAPSTRHTDAQGASSSMTPPSPGSSSFTAAPTEARPASI